jgi:F0F1-type ATP synthase membrane subunit b/b'
VNRTTKFVIVSIVGPVAMGLLYFAVMKPAVTGATRELTNNMQNQSAAVVERSKAQQAESARRAAEAQRAQLETQAAQLRADSAAALAEQQEAARKEAAWRAFFQPKKVCDNPPDFDTQVECGNAYMRAKRDFDARWERGELR